MLALCDEAASEGARVYPQVFGRPTNILFSFRSVHPFFRHPSFLPLADKAPRDWLPHLRDPAFKVVGDAYIHDIPMGVCQEIDVIIVHAVLP